MLIENFLNKKIIKVIYNFQKTYRFDKLFSIFMTISQISLYKLIVYKNNFADSVEVSVADKAHIINSSANKKSPNGNDATSAQVDAVVDALQSTDSLSQVTTPLHLLSLSP